MDSVALGAPLRWRRSLAPIDARAISIWTLAGAVVLYLALDGGGYDIVVSSQVGILIWWVVVLGAAVGLIPGTHITLWGRLGLASLGGFALWTVIATTWSQSTALSLEEFSRVACYVGVLVLALATHRDREAALRHTIAAIASAIVVVAAIALLSRLRPGTFTQAAQTSTFLPGIQGRLAWPFNYWNALGALMALGLPLLFAIASTARRLVVQAIAAGAIPMVVLCGYLTFSRGAAIEATGGVLLFLVLTNDRLPKLLSGLFMLAGSAVLIAGAVHRSAVENGLLNAAARDQGRQLLIAVLLVCAATALVHAAIALAVRHGTRPSWLSVAPAAARRLLLGAVAIGLVAAFALGAPSRISHAWHQFKQPPSTSLHQNALGRFGSASGNNRYQYWKVAVDASGQHLIRGWGPGTFPLIWLQRAPNNDFVQNAHSLYIETLLEDGLVGLALLAGFFVLVIGRAVAVAARSVDEHRTRGAAVAAACVAFAISAAVDWVWQIPALPIAFVLLAAAALAPAAPRVRVRAGAVTAAATERPRGRIPQAWRLRAIRGALVALGIGCLIAITIPLADTNALRQSQAAAANGQTSQALSYARVATEIEPGSAAAQLQLALVLEVEGRLPLALSAAEQATDDEPLNWSAWLVRSRLEAELGQTGPSLVAFERARALNPHSMLFENG
jgi:O-Antigen ligase